MPYKDIEQRRQYQRDKRKNWKKHNHVTPYVYAIEFPDGAIYFGYSKQRYRFGQHFHKNAKWSEATKHAVNNGFSKDECLFTKLFICEDLEEVKRWEAVIIFDNVDDPLMLNTTIPRPPLSSM